ncbi:MAG: helix-turn-helix domain-containing protein [Halomonas sp.]|uniref:helix-turn-helix domain-containing protein n=1 Tax=Halomonas sp. TaxID=1486246 RepID=UPI003F93F3AB
MNAMLDQAAIHWAYIEPLLSEPQNEEDYDAKVAALDELLDMMGDDEDHPLASLAVCLGDVIEAYDENHRPISKAPGAEVLRYLMAEHRVLQSELPEVGAQSVVSAILSGKRQLNWRQVCELAERFGVPTDVFQIQAGGR